MPILTGRYLFTVINYEVDKHDWHKISCKIKYLISQLHIQQSYLFHKWVGQSMACFNGLMPYTSLLLLYCILNKKRLKYASIVLRSAWIQVADIFRYAFLTRLSFKNMHLIHFDYAKIPIKLCNCIGKKKSFARFPRATSMKKWSGKN